MKFKAHIIRANNYNVPYPNLITTFSREWIIENIDRTTGKRWPNENDKSLALCTYTFEKIRDKEDKKQFQITMHPIDSVYNLKINLWNRFLCNWLHKRYVLNKDGGEWFFKTLIAAIIGALLGLISLTIGYRQGYQTGLKEAQSQNQDTTLKR